MAYSPPHQTSFLFLFISILLASSVHAGPDDVADGGSDYAKPAIETGFLGAWAIDNPNAGVAAMQLQLMPNDKIVWFDTTSLGPSGIKMQPEGNCPINPDANNQPDCYAHAIAYDWKTTKVRTLTLKGDAWCSSGNLWPNGNMVATGGTFTGNKAVRMIPNNDDPNADFDTRLNVLGDGRWYSSNAALADGSAIVCGGRDTYSCEIVPPSLEFTPRRYDMPFLQETTTPALGPGRPVENNLYPFMFLLPTGSVFLYANNRAITFDPMTGKVLVQHPECPGEIVVCGGNVPTAYQVVDARHVTEKEFMPALRDCYRIQPLDENAQWVKEQDMPSGRTMGDLVILPNAELLMLNGAMAGTAGWEDSKDANLTPLLYTPNKPMGNRWKELAPTTIARMYHSCSALLPDTKILVAGSNMHQFYTFDVEYPTELRVEKFSPPYLDPALDQERPTINAAATDKAIKYALPFRVAATLGSNAELVLGENIVTLVYPPFTTHGFSQSQREIIVPISGIEKGVINCVAPLNGMVAPPGYYMLWWPREPHLAIDLDATPKVQNKAGGDPANPDPAASKDAGNQALNLVSDGLNAARDVINKGLGKGGPADGASDYTKPEIETKSLGEWKIDCPDVGVGAMQLQLMPNDQVVWFDATTLGQSAKKLDPPGNCPPNPDTQNTPDCWAHCIAYDWKTKKIRTIKLSGEPWCSSGNLWPNGNMVATGGTFSGVKAVRMLPMNDLKSDFIEKKDALGDFRWYACNQVLEDGSAVLVGGRESFSIEIVPPSLEFKPKKMDFPFLKETCTPPKGPNKFIENNLYPFVYLLPDGNTFLFANDRSINFNPHTGKILVEHPVLKGGARNYPASAMSALLPLKLGQDNLLPINVEVVICGGNTKEAFEVVDAKHVTDKVFVPAFKDCHRLQPTKPGAKWEAEQDMPSERVMGDLIHLPTGDLLMLNGAKKGTAAWEDAIDPNFTPVLYSPCKPMGNRFKELKPTNIARMYHSSSALLPDTTVLVAGSNPHQFYTFNHVYPTELRVERFSPPYLDPALDNDRPTICEKTTKKVLKYKAQFQVVLTPLKSNKVVELGDVKITMIYPPFTTHGFSQNQRMIVPFIQGVQKNIITAFAPPCGNIAPPGYYMMFVSYLGVPGPGIWVHIDK
ncbi:hypothetical protein OSB04_021421 [Centaurea solstitialis]|uniref:Galactose oxidase n=1 Tax=Centaurea solstitialis TaxID=347529 RepID=A0AA38SUG7_9ASTR|nr:hypothetical protein OSB04_021421 [Centaurea solstitialis]